MEPLTLVATVIAALAGATVIKRWFAWEALKHDRDLDVWTSRQNAQK